ncbi:hypothetical protein SAMN05216257_105122 [Meinhardsimonia xiamenensis]|jgi:hypothetical protein|uniref:Uncharacterized protein n=1 Tax=Meinhardsimonia xiamenensis TaxID=990712 RepID=A0A1G9FBU0_9RHOB|nr:hypothetical protein [Meinhardsimonia xiamenensis]PRX37909.1 hypothetical protein LV81_00181 [Meinhardsimonia xiamenensis]SDK85831.1 hypothetical protein SAMN05216257_105122 [Meinhardsimonia xiamenensis]
MAVTLKEVEAIPGSYPPAPGLLSDAASMLNHAAIWQRIEAYCRDRWTARQVVWTVEGGGTWEPPLSPATVNTVEVWEGGAWVPCTPAASPLGGYELPGEGPYRITADVGGGEVPAAVSEAFRRLAEYLADATDRAGVSSYSVNMGGAIQESYQRSPAWVARAMELSGAADLLRPYKRRA